MAEDSLRARFEADLKGAMRSGDTVSRDAIRFLLSALKNAEIDKRAPLTGEEDVALLRRQAKRMQESIEQYRAGNRDDLVAKEQAQLDVLNRYLPAELGEEELIRIVTEAIAETGASGQKEMGKVMQVVVAKAAGRADGKRLSAAVRAALGG